MSSLIGQTLGRYHTLSNSARAAWRPCIRRTIRALKRMWLSKLFGPKPCQNAVERALKRFECEAKALARLTHPNIVPVMDYGNHAGQPYLVMKYLPWGKLKQLLHGKPMIPWQNAVRLLIPVARALDYPHRPGMVHRDVRPANILIAADGAPMLSDFGIAKIIDEEVTMDLTGTSATRNTPLGVGLPWHRAA